MREIQEGPLRELPEGFVALKDLQQACRVDEEILSLVPFGDSFDQIIDAAIRRRPEGPGFAEAARAQRGELVRFCACSQLRGLGVYALRSSYVPRLFAELDARELGGQYGIHVFLDEEWRPPRDDYVAEEEMEMFRRPADLESPDRKGATAMTDDLPGFTTIDELKEGFELGERYGDLYRASEGVDEMVRLARRTCGDEASLADEIEADRLDIARAAVVETLGGAGVYAIRNDRVDGLLGAEAINEYESFEEIRESALARCFSEIEDDLAERYADAASAAWLADNGYAERSLDFVTDALVGKSWAEAVRKDGIAATMREAYKDRFENGPVALKKAAPARRAEAHAPTPADDARAFRAQARALSSDHAPSRGRGR